MTRCGIGILIGWTACVEPEPPVDSGSTATETSAPADSGSGAQTGEDLYRLHCGACHGEQGEGTDQGPELSHTSHKPDDKILSVILEGKGDMEPVDVSEEEAQAIVDHLRVLFPPDAESE